MTFFCNDVSGCPVPSLLHPSTLTLAHLKAEVGWPADGIYGLGSWKASGAVLGYYLLSLVLQKILPAEEVDGTVMANGDRLKYRFNSTSIALFYLSNRMD